MSSKGQGQESIKQNGENKAGVPNENEEHDSVKGIDKINEVPDLLRSEHNEEEREEDSSLRRLCFSLYEDSPPRSEYLSMGGQGDEQTCPIEEDYKLGSKTEAENLFVINPSKRFWYKGEGEESRLDFEERGIDFSAGCFAEEDDEEILLRITRPEFRSRENIALLPNIPEPKRMRPSPDQTKTYCYWSNLGLVKENVVKSMFATAEVPEGLRPTMSRVGPEDALSLEPKESILPSQPSLFLGKPLAHLASTYSTPLHVDEQIRNALSAPKKKKNLVARAAHKLMKMMRKKR